YVDAAFGRRWLTVAIGLLVVASAAISAATIAAGSVGYLKVFLPLSSAWIVVGVILSMGAIACLATTQSVAFAGVMTLIEVVGLALVVAAGLAQGSEAIARLPAMVPAALDGAAWVAVGSTTIIAVFAFI